MMGKMEFYCVCLWKFGKGEALQMKNEVWRMKNGEYLKGERPGK